MTKSKIKGKGFDSIIFDEPLTKPKGEPPAKYKWETVLDGRTSPNCPSQSRAESVPPLYTIDAHAYRCWAEPLVDREHNK